MDLNEFENSYESLGDNIDRKCQIEKNTIVFRTDGNSSAIIGDADAESTIIHRGLAVNIVSQFLPELRNNVVSVHADVASICLVHAIVLRSPDGNELSVFGQAERIMDWK